MRNTFSIVITLLVFSIGAWPKNAAAQQPQSPAEDEPIDALRDIYREEAAAYDLFLDADRTMKLALEPKPVMSWTGTDGWSGDIFVWTHGGRPPQTVS